MSHTEIPTTGTEPCTKADPELFFVFDSQTDLVAAAKGLCSQCPVKAECLQWALGHNVDGIWGGTTKTERDAMKRRRAPIRIALGRAAA